ncbi:hypothetical protein Ciccas_000859 [Cichlidogyrus casuarinus]|uniref:Uncharacterized protein n=1 Tax=Cichlidogyrus casuarinus TaxID=1844966 RepID=A0ABD2QLN5_9PLAT
MQGILCDGTIVNTSTKNNGSLLRHQKGSALLEAIEGEPLELDWIPNHAQALERTVQMVTRTAKKVFGQDVREIWCI